MRTEIRYPPEPYENETRIEWERRALRPWRMEEKRRMFLERGSNCERCWTMAQDLDEGILPRSSMRGLPLWKRRLAFGTCNLFLLCTRCNREEAHQVEWAFWQSCQRYGEQRVRAWYASLELRAPDFRFMPKL